MLTIPVETKYAQPRMSSIDGIGLALLSLRKRAGLSQAAVEGRAGLSNGSLSRFERGDQHPRIETLGGILDALDADLYDLGVEVRKTAGRELPTMGSGPHSGGLRLTEAEWNQLEEEARATARAMVRAELRTMRGDPEEP